MNRTASFEVEILPDAMQHFAEWSGDWNPLHTNAEYATSTEFRRPVLHGAFSAGLVSRMAGMHLPGEECLLRGLTLRFNAPVQPPARLLVQGEVLHDDGVGGRVAVTVNDARTGKRYVDASYEFGRHARAKQRSAPISTQRARAGAAPRYLITGSRGGLGRALMQRLGTMAIGVSRTPGDGLLHVHDLAAIEAVAVDVPLRGIIHCAWPMPDNSRLLSTPNFDVAVDHHLATPVKQVLALARLLARYGEPDSMLVLVGSTFAQPGRHNYRMPLYSLGKSLVPELARVLAIELGATERRCAAVVYDVLDGGMNERLSPRNRLAAEDRSPRGRIATLEQAAEQIVWLLDNSSFLVSGATLQLSGGALP